MHATWLCGLGVGLGLELDMARRLALRHIGLINQQRGRAEVGRAGAWLGLGLGVRVGVRVRLGLGLEVGGAGAWLGSGLAAARLHDGGGAPERAQLAWLGLGLG